MKTVKGEFISKFLPKSIENFSFVQIDMDISDLSISDILRNVNGTLPVNSNIRNNVISGLYAVVILCKSELLYPMDGLLIIVSNDNINLEILSSNYIVLGIPESKISSTSTMKDLVDSITDFLVKEFRNILDDFNSFYVKYVYDPHTEEDDFGDIVNF
jgi:hypothetical protein